MPPVISNLTFAQTDTTIDAAWDTDIAADSNLYVTGGSGMFAVTNKPGIDNGFAAAVTTGHRAIVTGLQPGTTYSCFVVSGSTSSTPQNVTTNARPSRLLATGASNSAFTASSSPLGDTYRSFVSNDNNTYMTQDDGNGFVVGSPNSGYNTELGLITNESTFAGTLVSLANYGAKSSLNGTDGPGAAAMTNKSTGLIGLNGNLHMFVYRQFPPTYSTNRYANVIKSTNHGSTWNNFNQPSTFTAGGNPVSPNSPAEPMQFFSLDIGLVTPVLYAADDGTLGYRTTGNLIDGGNAYIYMTFRQDAAGVKLALMRVPRIRFDAQQFTFEYWVGAEAPTIADFTNDANWSNSPTNATNICKNGNQWVQIVFVPAINSYVMFTYIDTTGGTIFYFYAAPTPAGPWRRFFIQPNSTTNNKWYGPFPMHRDVFTNALTNNIPIRIVYAGEPAGTNYKVNYSTLTITTTAYVENHIAVVQEAESQGSVSSTSQALAFRAPNKGGNTLILNGYAQGTVTVDDNAGSQGGSANNTWQKLANGPWVAYNCQNTTNPITVTIHGTVSGSTIISALCEVQGGISAVDQTVSGSVAGTSVLMNNLTPTRTPSIAFASVGIGVQRCTLTPKPPWNDVAGVSNVAGSQSSPFQGFSYELLSGLTATNGTITPNSSTTNNYNFFNMYGQQFSISGNAGIAGAIITYTGLTSGDSGTVTADGAGNYTIPNLYNGSYTIKPSSGGSGFTPPNQVIVVNGANMPGVNFVLSTTADSRYFDGTDYMTGPASAVYSQMSKFTLSMWVKVLGYTNRITSGPSVNYAFNALLAKDPLGTFPWYLFDEDGQFSGYSFNQTVGSYTGAGSNDCVPGVLPTGSWQHVALTFDFTAGGRPLHYINGIAQSPNQYDIDNPNLSPPGATPPNDSAGLVWIGYDDGFDGFSGHFIGEMTDVRIYNRVLSQSEILSITTSKYATGIPGTSNLVAWWKMQLASPLADSSGNGNALTNSGTTGGASEPQFGVPPVVPVSSVLSSGTPGKLNGAIPLTAAADLIFSFNKKRGNLSVTFQAVGTVTALTASLQVSLDAQTWTDYIPAGSFVSNTAQAVTVRPLVAGALYRVHATVVTGSIDIWAVSE